MLPLVHRGRDPGAYGPSMLMVLVEGPWAFWAARAEISLRKLARTRG